MTYTKNNNYELMAPVNSAPIKMWTQGVPVEPEAREQLLNTAKMPFVFKHLAVMPDVHLGKGSTIGSVIPTRGAIIPAAVGVDIGCGMIAVRTSLVAADLPDSLAGLRSAIEQAVPHGRSSTRSKRDKGSWTTPPQTVDRHWAELAPRFNRLIDKYPRLRNTNNYQHLGTLGTGNHFIEVCLDETQQVWVMLHSGSRGVGNAIGSLFIALAQQDMQQHIANLPDRNLAYFEAVNCHHNYVQRETHFGEPVLVTRKGAVSAQKGQMGIIPGSMGAKSFIVRGLGNEESFCSCSHGAGRTMSRTAAKKRFTVADQIRATEHVECRKDSEVIDEIPMAYKDIDAVMAAQSSLVEIVHTLRQVVCVKG